MSNKPTQYFFQQDEKTLIPLDILSNENGKVVFVEAEEEVVFIEAEDFLHSINNFLANSENIWDCEEPYLEWLSEEYPRKQVVHGEITDKHIKALVDDWNKNAEENEVPEMTYEEVRDFFNHVA